MSNQYGGSRTDTLIKLVLVFFLSLLSFSVGTFVGKQFSDSQHKIAELETEGAGDRATASIPETKTEPNQVISEDEIAKLSEEFVKKEKSVEKETAPDASTAKNEKHPAAKAKPDTASIHDEITSVAKKLAANDKAEAKVKVENRIPSSLPAELADSTIGKYTVQVSSQAKETEAKAKVDQLKEKGFSAFYVPAELKGKTWYRVSVGQFDDRGTALKYRTKLMIEAGLESAIVQKITK